MKIEETASARKDLRELARRIQEETDPNKMIELVQQLIAGFDKQQLLQNGKHRGDGLGDPLGEKVAESAESGGAQGVQ
jgi:hypothetical protein